LRELSREPRTYELMTILHPEVGEDEIPPALDRIASVVTTVGGTVTDTQRDSPWGRRRLAYPIRHGGRDLRDGYYTLFHLTLGPERVDDVEQELKLNDQVIRYLLTSYTPKPLDPRAVEDAEIAAEEAAASAYAAAQAEAARLVQQRAAPAAPAAATATETAAPADTEPGGAPVAVDAGGDQPIQGAAGVAGQPVAAAEDAAGEPPAGVQRAEAEAAPAPDAAEAEEPAAAPAAGQEPEEG